MENKKNNTFKKYYLLSVLGVLLASGYPIYMGITVLVDMIRYGTVYAENYPKYIIPYTPVALAVLLGVVIIPLVFRRFNKYALLVGSAISTAVFFVVEMVLEKTVIVTRTVTEIVGVVDSSLLESWQMYMCYIPPNRFEERTWTEVDVLMGEYSPAFKLHFYLISVVLIVCLLNSFYGFAQMIKNEDKSRWGTLILQSITSVSFLGMCIWACFTAFYRTGAVYISAWSAVLMCVFFVLLGVTVGICVASLTVGKRFGWSVVFPSVVASVITLVMYLGEMILLSGNLYRFGRSWFFQGIEKLVLAPVDLVVIFMAGLITAVLIRFVCRPCTPLNSAPVFDTET